MKNYYVHLQGFDVNGTAHDKRFSIAAETFDGDKVRAEWEAETGFNNITIVLMKDLGTIVGYMPNEAETQPDQEDTMAKKTTAKKASKKKATRKTAK